MFSFAKEVKLKNIATKIDWRSISPAVWAFLFVKITSDENPFETLDFTAAEEDEIFDAHAKGLLDDD